MRRVRMTKEIQDECIKQFNASVKLIFDELYNMVKIDILDHLFTSNLLIP